MSENNDNLQEWSADQESRQHPICVFEDDELHLAEQMDIKTIAMASDIATKCDAVVSMEAVVNYIDVQGKSVTLGNTTIAMANMAIGGFADQAGIATDARLLSMESDGYSQSVDQMKSAIGSAYSGIKKKLTSLAKHVAEVLAFFGRNLMKLKIRLKLLEQSLAEMKQEHPKLNAIKAENWCEYLCYSNKGFVGGLTGIGEAIEELISSHRKMSTDAVHKYTGWLKDNRAFFRDAPDTQAVVGQFSELTSNSNEFLLPNMSLFNRTIGLDEPADGFAFYRSKELPGGRAFYSEVCPGESKSTDVISALSGLNFRVDYFDPTSYKTMKMKVVAAVAIPMTMWLAYVNPALGLVAGAGTALYLSQQKINGSGSEQVRMTKDMVYPCLTRVQLEKVVQVVKENIKALEKWDRDVLQDAWKANDIDEVIASVTDGEVEHPVLKSYCNALLALIAKIGSGVQNYAFRVLNAMINFAQKSQIQYV